VVCWCVTYANTYLTDASDEGIEIVLLDGSENVDRMNLPADIAQLRETVRRLRLEGYSPRYRGADLARTIELLTS
jgi:hypothetical protein